MYFVFDIGGTNTRMAVSSDGKILKESKMVFTPPDFEQGIRLLKQVASEFSGKEKIESIAGGIAGPLDKEKTMLVASPHISGWIKKPLKRELEKNFGCTVILENDAVLEGLGEALHGAGTSNSIVAFITVGTGVGGVRIVNGKIDTNALGFEPGHQIIVPDGRSCRCGGRGHLEAYVGGSYLKEVYQQDAENLKDASVWRKVAKYLAIGLNNIIVHWSPDIVILGGSVIKSIPLETVSAYLNKELKIFPNPPKIVLATLEKDAGLYGALNLLVNP